jgi:hypothetical protein
LSNTDKHLCEVDQVIGYGRRVENVVVYLSEFKYSDDVPIILNSMIVYITILLQILENEDSFHWQ